MYGRSAGKAGLPYRRVGAFLELRWGRLQRWEDYEDTERVTEWDRRRAATTTAPG